MRSLLLVWVFLSTLIFANEQPPLDSNETTAPQIEKEAKTVQSEQETLSKVIYLNYESIPQRVLKGEIFTVTIKALSTLDNFTDIAYDLSNSVGLKLLSDFPSREIDKRYYFETFYFLATSNDIRLPDFRAYIVGSESMRYEDTTLEGQKLNVISLNPDSDFSNIIAKTFDIIEYKTTSYNDKHNIVVFVAAASNCDIAALKLGNVYKQGIESVTESYFDSKITYYAIIDKKIENLSFTYFNIDSNRFIPINIPIIVNDDSVTTQSDLSPKNQSHEILKMGVAAAVAFVAFIMVIFRRKYIYLLFIFLPLAYIAYAGAPMPEVCIKEGAAIRLLPVNNGTIFETTLVKYHLQKEDEIDGWTKVQLKNQKIGWVKNEDICSN